MKRFIGIDVSKDTLDVFVRPDETRRRFDNSPEGIAELVVWLRSFQAERIVLESTGPYQKAALAAMLADGLPAVLVNARQVRDFAKALGKLVKTDAVDAAVIAHFAEVIPTTIKPLPSKELQEIRDLFDRRQQLVSMIAAEKNRRHAAAQSLPKVVKNIEKVIDFLKRQVADFEERIDNIVESSDAFKAQNEILQSVTGIGPQVSRTMIAYLPELGRRSRQSITALVGLAPYNDDSGNHSGERHIRGGRAKVRVALYQAAVVAIRCCPKMKAFFASLKARGKATKVAIIAVARKILVLANALVRDNAPYKPSANSVC